MLDSELSFLHLAILGLSLAIAFGFEVVNGFHDTATAVATVIYTKSLRPTAAVMWSGIWNGLGVLYATATGLAVAFSIVHLLPVDLVVSLGTATGLAMVFSLLAAAILWNLGTWYLGLPVSSSHTLIGSVLGVGLASALMSGRSVADAVNWAKAREVFLALIVSPAIGFVGAAVLLILAASFLRDRRLFEPPVGDTPPPLWIRAVLVCTCTGVSFAHGSNDGQKGIGLIMLVLIGTLPASYALNTRLSPEQSAAMPAALEVVDETVQRVSRRTDGRTAAPNAARGGAHVEWNHVTLTADPIPPTPESIRAHLNLVRGLTPAGGLSAIAPANRWRYRQELLRLTQAVNDYVRAHREQLNDDERARFRDAQRTLRPAVEFAPTWVALGVAVSLGVGTMVGWRRVVVTVGEKIGKKHVTYAQGACAELVTMGTILTADVVGLPVSTTHVLSGGIAGTMVANRSGIQGKTVRNIAAAWVVTLPAAMLLSGTLYSILVSGLSEGGAVAVVLSALF